MLSIASSQMRRLRQRITVAEVESCSTSPWPRAQRLRCAQSAPKVEGTSIPTSACGSYVVCQPAEQQPPRVRSMSSVAMRPS